MEVFASYRRDDSKFVVELVKSIMEQRLGVSTVFTDTSHISAGIDYRLAIAEAIGDCRTVLVLIGPGWRTDRLFDEQDSVTFELQLARAQGKRIIPVIHGDVRMPSPDDLPPTLSWLPFLNGHRLDDPVRDSSSLAELIHADHRQALHRSQLFIAGSDSEGAVEPYASSLGKQLASTGISVVSAAGTPGVALSMAMCRALLDAGAYEPSRANFHFRRLDHRPPQLPERFGTVHYSGTTDKPSMIEQMLERTRAAVLIAGSTKSEREAQQALRQRIPLIPLAASGGAAMRVWTTLGDEILGMRQHDAGFERDFKLLAERDPDRVVQAANRLIRRVME